MSGNSVAIADDSSTGSPQSIAAAPPGEATANSVKLPKQILKTGVNISAARISPNSKQLADILNLTPTLEKISATRTQVKKNEGTITIETLSVRQDLNDAVSEATQMIYKCDLEVDYCSAEITAEQNLYQEILSNYTASRDKRVLQANAISFITNGALWAIGEGFDVPTFRYPRLSIPSGTISILAGIVPSIASMYALYAVNGKKSLSEVDPNMLAKVFNYPTPANVDYPKSVWEFFNAVPPNDKSGKSRRDQLVDRWVSDANIPSFTDRGSAKQLDVLTAGAARKKGLSIEVLSTRLSMLSQLSSELQKMKQLLLELAMVVHGDKSV